MTETVPTARKDSTARRVVKYGVALIAVGLLAVTIWSQRESFAESLRRLGWRDLVLAAAAAAAALAASGLSWRASMIAVAPHHKLPLRESARVFFLSQIGKYVPGSVFPMLMQIELTRRHGISRTANAAGMLVAMLVGLVTSGLVGVGALTLVNREAVQTYWFVLIVLPIGVILLKPTILARFVTLLAKLLRRDVRLDPPEARHLLIAATWSLTSWLLFGLQAWIIAKDIASGGDVTYLQATGAFALAWLVGFLVVISPAGVGAREGVLVVAFSGSLTTAEGLAFAVVSRLVLTAVDGLAALLGAALRPHHPAGDDA
ncbi:lysylphosphatidylglycerol synthase transmembrane domain-containing protein [Nocardioides panacihumi]|uniref:Lysylphosphatidylglycerol synthase transmembrane domain-containing protein n=1 Tax=Nocardioides panacihumi TaxID=400774 RepID=A0ABP5CFB8_9ACTN